ncbi:MAG: preprotein translocase subunit SecE [Gammaproteobacteria bacterium]|nr:preprotein translocase subunit SecE [Gammaproteobacteria bacterium]MDH5730543.1 preprotein translocase subunit SecE [Gammaproteobacteria bacterium]
MADRIKLILAVLILGGGIVGFYYYADQSVLYRVLALLALLGVSVAIALSTEIGRSSWSFFKEARTEVRKVVWPTRKETSQTTLLIMLSVMIVGVFLWLLDMGLLWGVKILTGQGS